MPIKESLSSEKITFKHITMSNQECIIKRSINTFYT